jgi:hypothetical protein
MLGGLDHEDPIMQLLVQHAGGGDSSSGQSLQATGPTGDLMDRLQTNLEWLTKTHEKTLILLDSLMT